MGKAPEDGWTAPGTKEEKLAQLSMNTQAPAEWIQKKVRSAQRESAGKAKTPHGQGLGRFHGSTR
jgi:hypothetical protein